MLTLIRCVARARTRAPSLKTIANPSPNVNLTLTLTLTPTCLT